MKKIISTKVWLPDYIAANLLDMEIDKLKSEGITHIVFDLDRTLVPSKVDAVTPEYMVFIDGLKAAGFAVLLGSNRRRDISGFTKQLAVDAVKPKGLAMKPRRAFYKRVITAANTSPNRIAMAGDHIINDVWGGNRSGLTTIMIQTVPPKTRPKHKYYSKFALRYTK